MGHGFVSDPGQLTSLATTVYRLKQKYDAVTVSSQTEGEPLGSLDVESGVTTIQTKWSRKKPEIGQLLDQMATGLFAAAREYGWTEEQARRDASDNPDGSTPGGSHPGSGGGGGGSADRRRWWQRRWRRGRWVEQSRRLRSHPGAGVRRIRRAVRATAPVVARTGGAGTGTGGAGGPARSRRRSGEPGRPRWTPGTDARLPGHPGRRDPAPGGGDVPGRDQPGDPAEPGRSGESRRSDHAGGHRRGRDAGLSGHRLGQRPDPGLGGEGRQPGRVGEPGRHDASGRRHRRVDAHRAEVRPRPLAAPCTRATRRPTAGRRAGRPAPATASDPPARTAGARTTARPGRRWRRRTWRPARRPG